MLKVTHALDILLNKVDLDELLIIILGHYGHSTTENELVRFGPDGGEPRLVVSFLDHKVSVESIKEGDEIVIERLVSKNLIENQVEKFGQAILFTFQHPVRGVFRYENFFQIIPIPDHAPRPEFAVGDHPCLIQFKYLSSPNVLVNHDRLRRGAQQIVDFMNCLTRGSFKMHSNLASSVWIMDGTTRDGHSQYAYKQKGYHYFGFRSFIEAFDDVAILTPIKQIDSDAYYSDSGYAAEEHIVLPASITHDLDVVYNLDTIRREKFNRACIWTQFAQNAWSVSRSLALIATVTAVEALIQKSSNERKCETCSRAINPSANERFRSFLDRYISSDAETLTFIKEVYKTRSLLAHGDRILDSDYENSSFSFKTMTEGRRLRAFNSIMYHALRRWLLDHDIQD